jgi:hypothetical protein
MSMSTDESRDNNPIDSEEQIAELIEIDADSIEDVALEDIWIAEIPLGKLLSKALQNSTEAKERTESHEQAIKHLNATTTGSSDASSPNEENTSKSPHTAPRHAA